MIVNTLSCLIYGHIHWELVAAQYFGNRRITRTPDCETVPHFFIPRAPKKGKNLTSDNGALDVPLSVVSKDTCQCLKDSMIRPDIYGSRRLISLVGWNFIVGMT